MTKSKAKLAKRQIFIMQTSFITSHLLEEVSQLTHYTLCLCGIIEAFVTVREEEIPQYWSVDKGLEDRVHKACVAKVIQSSEA